jgi:hypothetical protein
VEGIFNENDIIMDDISAADLPEGSFLDPSFGIANSPMIKEADSQLYHSLSFAERVRAKHGLSKLHFLQPPELLSTIAEYLTANEWLTGARRTC